VLYQLRRRRHRSWTVRPERQRNHANRLRRSGTRPRYKGGTNNDKRPSLCTRFAPIQPGPYRNRQVARNSDGGHFRTVSRWELFVGSVYRVVRRASVSGRGCRPRLPHIGRSQRGRDRRPCIGLVAQPLLAICVLQSSLNRKCMCGLQNRTAKSGCATTTLRPPVVVRCGNPKSNRGSHPTALFLRTKKERQGIDICCLRSSNPGQRANSRRTLP